MGFAAGVDGHAIFFAVDCADLVLVYVQLSSVDVVEAVKTMRLIESAPAMAKHVILARGAIPSLTIDPGTHPLLSALSQGQRCAPRPAPSPYFRFDPRYREGRQRFEQRESLLGLIRAWTGERTTAEIIELCEMLRIPVAAQSTILRTAQGADSARVAIDMYSVNGGVCRCRDQSLRAAHEGSRSKT